MKRRQLDRWRSFYRSADAYGSAAILRNHLGVGDEYIVPLSLAHGVDQGQMGRPLDVRSVEPIHWAFNEEIAISAQRFKPVARIPHPVLLYGDGRTAPRDLGTLVVGPPPGPQNDRRLLECLRDLGVDQATILVKGRGVIQPSLRFWEGEGFRAVTLGSESGFNYPEMVDLLGRFDHMICCYISSAAYFMAALGGRVSFIRNYHVSVLETLNYSRHFLSSYEASAPPFRQMIEADDNERRAFSRMALGSDYSFAPEDIVREIDRALDRASGPLHNDNRYWWPIGPAMMLAARLADRPGIIATPLRERLVPASRKLEEVRTNEIAVWLDGPNEENFSARPARYIPGVTRAGYAADQYPADG